MYKVEVLEGNYSTAHLEKTANTQSLKMVPDLRSTRTKMNIIAPNASVKNPAKPPPAPPLRCYASLCHNKVTQEDQSV